MSKRLTPKPYVPETGFQIDLDKAFDVMQNAIVDATQKLLDDTLRIAIKEGTLTTDQANRVLEIMTGTKVPS